MRSKEERLAANKAAVKRYQSRHAELLREKARARYHRDPEGCKAKNRRYRETHREAVNTWNRINLPIYRRKLRAEFLKEYGGHCACCGESEPLFLQLDHIFSDGHHHRRSERIETATVMLAKLKKAGWPKDRFRILCCNCNFGRSLNGGVCPHEKAREVAA